MSEHQHHRVLSVLSRHVGKAQALTMKQLALEVAAFHLGLDSKPICARHIRKSIEDLRLQGHAVCGHPKRGYWIALDEKDLEETSNFLHSRAMKSLRQVAAMRKQTLADLLGQLHLPT